MPTSTKAAISSEVATGRRMNGVEMLMRRVGPPVRSAAGLGRRCGLPVASLTATRVPCCRRDWPSVTTTWPSSSPLVTTATVPLSRATSTSCRATVESGLTT